MFVHMHLHSAVDDGIETRIQETTVLGGQQEYNRKSTNKNCNRNWFVLASVAVVCDVHPSFSDFIWEFWKHVAQLAVCDVLISTCA